MKSIIACVFVVLAVVALSTGKETTQPPKMCDLVCPYPLPDETLLLPHPERCELYCQCDTRGAIEMKCPPMNAQGDSLFFSPEIQGCDWPVNVDCTND